MDSYEKAAKAFVDGELPEGSVLVHGTALNSVGDRTRRAWVVLPDWSVWEPVSGKMFPKGAWERQTESRAIRKYNRRMAVQKVKKTHSYGPWGRMA